MMGGGGGKRSFSSLARLGGGVVFVCLEKVVHSAKGLLVLHACMVFLVAELFCLGR